LIKIEDILGSIVSFNYDFVQISNSTGITESLFYSDYTNNSTSLDCYPGTQNLIQCGTLNRTTCSDILNFYSVSLKEITTNDGGKVNFYYDDTQPGGDKLLTRIEVKDFLGIDKYKFSLQYEKVTCTGFSSVYQSSFTRAFLSRLMEVPVDGAVPKVHKFSYYNLNDLPVLLTMAQDYWGYFNGRLNNSLVETPVDFDLQAKFPAATANRSPNYATAKYGCLSRIDYPTGGYEEIEYEGNKYRGSKLINPPVTSKTVNVTGTSVYTQVLASVSTIVISSAQNVRLNYSILPNLPIDQLDVVHHKGTVTLTRVGGGMTAITDNANPSVTKSMVVSLNPGTYKLEVAANGTMVTTAASIYYFEGLISPVTDNYDWGGLRVSMISSYDRPNNAPSIRKYYYSKLATQNISSGGNQFDPNYYKPFIVRKFCKIFIPPNSSSIEWKVYECKFAGLYSYALNSINRYPEGSSYASVVEGFGSNFENGAIEHNFQVYGDQPGFLLNQQAEMVGLATMSNNSILNGKETSKIVFKAPVSAGIKVSEQINVYKNDTRKYKEFPGVVVNKTNQTPNWGTVFLAENFPVYFATQYILSSRWSYLDQVTDIVYDVNGANPVSKTTKYTYDNENHMLPSKIEVNDSKGENIQTNIKYPLDFAGITATDAESQSIKSLQTKNILDAPIEQYVIKKKTDGSNSRLLFSTYNIYRTDNNLLNYIAQTQSRVPLVNFVPLNVLSGAIVKDGRYKKQLSIDAYDSYGNLLQQKKEGIVTSDALTSFIWGYNSAYPIAKINNAAYSDVAYTSFENGSTGNWTYSGTPVSTTANLPSGTMYYPLTTSTKLSKTVVSGKKYVVSFWKPTSASPYSLIGGTSTSVNGITINGWDYAEYQFAATSSLLEISGTGNLDEVRIYPAGAMMNTYSYVPLYGQNTMIDENSNASYFEFDGLGRVTQKKDRYFNVLNRFCYNYWGQPELCEYNLNAVWYSTGLTRCKPCPANSIYTSDVLQREEKDVNPRSATYNSLRWTDIGISSNCLIVADWKNTVTAIRCKKNASNQNTGEQEQEQKDNNPCSSTYNQTRWVYVGINTTACPLSVVCNTSNCTGVDKKCVSGVCQTGVKVYTSSVQLGVKLWECTYHFEWSDGSWSQNYTEQSTTNCLSAPQ
jgi:hypothetical protein